MTQEDLALKSGMNRSSISELERDTRAGRATLHTVQRLADALGVQLIDLLPRGPKKGRKP